MLSKVSLSGMLEIAVVDLPLLAVISQPAWWVIGLTMTTLACGAVYVCLRTLRDRSLTLSSAASVDRTPVRSPFDELAERHELSSEDVQLLRQAATQLELPSPVFLFVDPAFLDQFASGCEVETGAHALRQRLFGADPVETDVESGGEIENVSAVLDNVVTNLLSDLDTIETADTEAADEPAVLQPVQ
ncbi:hypothetical protein GC176_24070 [bacterium]|nr:hypothetical protein [bacterium]